jgi:hypothetical protein
MAIYDVIDLFLDGILVRRKNTSCQRQTHTKTTIISAYFFMYSSFLSPLMLFDKPPRPLAAGSPMFPS